VSADAQRACGGTRRFLRPETGVTLIEVTLMLIVSMSILGALAPILSAVVRRAENAAATTAMNRIALQMRQALTDMSTTIFTFDGSKTSASRVNVLVTDGDIPRECTAVSTACTAWQATVNNTSGLTDFLERHIVLNMPRGSAANDYPTDIWKGAYLTPPLDPDPWGNRYAVNVQFLGADTNDVVVLSAGPDEKIDTAYQANPLAAGGDDLIVLLEA
jgi:type II secretory pathway pseudopilin PulG